jgi:hypothetical protein
MPLIDFERGPVQLHRVYYNNDFQRWQQMVFVHCGPLAMAAIYQDIHAEFAARAAHPTAPLLTWSWIVGSHWPAPYYDIYAAMNPAGLTSPGALAQAHQNAALCLGLVFMDCAINRTEWWGSHHCELKGAPITARTYYLLPNPPAVSAIGHYP